MKMQSAIEEVGDSHRPKAKPDMSPARDGQGTVADVCGSVTVGVLAQV